MQQGMHGSRLVWSTIIIMQHFGLICIIRCILPGLISPFLESFLNIMRFLVRWAGALSFGVNLYLNQHNLWGTQPRVLDFSFAAFLVEMVT